MAPQIRELDAGFSIFVESDMEKYRADSFWTKEPETIEWIRSFQDGETFWDIGANIGIYSLFMAKLYPKSAVWAFEPQFINFIRLVQNVGMNKFGNILPLNIAFSRLSKVVHFFVKENEPGKSGGQLDAPIDEQGKNFTPREVLPVCVFSIDDFIKQHLVPPPDHLKIDVDGQEDSIIWGMQTFLGFPKLKSMLIEFNSNRYNVNLFKDFIKAHKFTDNNKFNLMENHSKKRRKEENIKAENIIFTRAI